MSQSNEKESTQNNTQDQNKKIIITADFPELVDLVEHNERPAFAIKSNGAIEIVPQAEKDHAILVPPSADKIPWLLPRGAEVIKHYREIVQSPTNYNAKLFAELVSYHQLVAELPDDAYYDLIAAWDMHTYRLEAVQYSPIIYCYAVPERGKSRTGKAAIYVAYRGIHLESLREPYIIRVAKDLRATLFFDVMDLWAKAQKSGSEDIMLMRFEKGSKIPRVMHPDWGPHRDIVYYEAFGATFAATNEPINSILESRAVQINMPETAKTFDNEIKPEHGRPLRERLVAFRAFYLNAPLCDIPKPARGRLGDILRPLQQIIKLVRPDREAAFLSLVQKIEAGRRAEKSGSVEAQLITILGKLRQNVDRGMLPVKLIADYFNKDRPEKHQWTYQFIGKKLSSLGFQKSSTSSGNATLIWNDDLLLRVAERYGLGKTPASPVSPVPQFHNAGETGETGDTGVSTDTLQQQTALN